MLLYGEEIQDQKEVEVSKACIEALCNYIGAEVFFPGKDSMLVLSKLKPKKWDASGNPICDDYSNPILDTRG